MQTLEEMKARVWHADLRLWIWRWQTLSLKDRAVFYRGRRFGQKGTKHKSLKNFNLDTECRRWKRNKSKEFDAPYLLTMSAKNGGWVRYQLLPASMHGHRVNIVHHDIEVNPDGSRVKYSSGHFHCVDCKLMGTVNTMKEYSCLPPKQGLLMQYRRDYYIPCEEDFDKYSSIRTEAGWWKRKFIQDEGGKYYLERKWTKPS